MRRLLVLGVALLLTQHCVAPPVLKDKETEEKPDQQPGDQNDLLEVEYHQYLNEVVEVLKSDPHFVKKLEGLSDDDLRSAKIAKELENLNIDVRSKLDEIKRIEIERLRSLASRMNEVQNGLDVDHLKIPQHLDLDNHETFETRDLERLILQTTKDLEREDKRRREEFRDYEMQKKLAQEEDMKGMDEEHRKKFVEELEAKKKKAQKHEPLHHPGSKAQLEEVWENNDHMDPRDFDPHAFFVLHDVDGNKVWDEIEVKSLLIREINKRYRNGELGNDPRERAEELERMREHLFNETDTNRDGVISLKEFIDQTKKNEFNQDEGWKTLDETPIFTEEDYQNYLQHHRQNMQNTIDNNILPNGYNPTGYDHQQQYPPQYGHVPVDHGMPPHQQPQFHGQLPPQPQFHGQQPPQPQFHGQQPPQPQFHGQQPPQPQFHGQQPPQPQFHGQQPPQPQFHGQQPPQPQFHGQQPPQPQFHGQQPPQPQFHGQQPPQPQFHEKIPVQHNQQQQYPDHRQIPQYQDHPSQNNVPPSHYDNHGQAGHQQQYGQQASASQQHVQQGQIPAQPQHAQQGQIPVQPQHAQQGQVPARQQPVQPIDVSERGQAAAAGTQQKNPNAANVEGQTPVSAQKNVPPVNDQTHGRQGHDEAPAAQSAKENVDRAPVPNVVMA